MFRNPPEKRSEWMEKPSTGLWQVVRSGKRQGQEAKEMIARVQKSENYYQALHIISEYVETELSASSQNDTKPPKKRGKEECR